MSWNKVLEYAVSGLIVALIAGAGTAISWGMLNISEQRRDLTDQKADMKIMRHEMKLMRKRDEELITMMGEEIKKLQLAVEETCLHLTETDEKEPIKKLEPYELVPLPQPQPKKDPESIPKKKDPSATLEKFFPPEQKTEDYQRILRDKFNQRTEQMQMQQMEK